MLRCWEVTLAIVTSLAWAGTSRKAHIPWAYRPLVDAGFSVAIQTSSAALGAQVSCTCVFIRMAHAHAYSRIGGVLRRCETTLASVSHCFAQARRARLQDRGRTGHLWMQGVQLPFRAQAWHLTLKCHARVLVYTCAHAPACSIFGSVLRCGEVTLGTVTPCFLQARHARL